MSFIFLHTAKHDKDNKNSYLFANPVEIISCHHPKHLFSCFQKLEEALDKGYYAAGFLSYEAGYYLSTPLLKPRTFSFPLCWFGVFSTPAPSSLSNHKSDYEISHQKLTISPEDYFKAIEAIKNHIRGGNTYQVNFTCKQKFHFTGDPYALYTTLNSVQPVSYSAFIDTGDFHIISLSPELFFRKTGDRLIMKPMKGTWPRNSWEDAQFTQQYFRRDEKNRAENVMITDLIRNDLGRISRCGTVKVKNLFAVETYPTLLQMTSTVESKIDSRISFYDIFKNIFPSGSITGAPKISTMRIIKTLEKEERKIYTGAIGFITPDRNAVFNVAIRTLLLQNGKGELGIGSGITIGSNPQEELQETLLKAEFLLPNDFQLIETMRWSKNEGFFLLPLHLRRLKKSARHFGFLYDEQEIKRNLKARETELLATEEYRVRLLLFRQGKIQLTCALLSKARIPSPKVKISTHVTRSNSIFLFHKTTQRSPYDQELEKARKQGYFDVLFTNERGEITEGAISNVFVRRGRYYYTPPLKCGLLPGVYREYLLRAEPTVIKEKTLFAEDLFKAEEIILTNSVRGKVPVSVSNI